MQEVAKHERSIKIVGGIAKIACIAGAAEGKIFEDTRVHMRQKNYITKKLTPATQAIVKSKL